LFHLTDTKLTTFPIFDGIPNLICETVTDAYSAITNFKTLVEIMEDRYKISQEYGAKNLDELNSKLPAHDKLPYILIVVDEVADLIMLSKHEIEECIVRIAQKARACGMFLILATQSPRREIVTGLLKCNLPSRIGLATTSSLDSRIIGVNGCEKLLGNGDALYSAQGRAPVRFQSPLITESEIENIVSSLRAKSAPEKELIAA
jgi:S-DNA-T family DNA segregation ATPase FtsK/SpoIIIE